MSTAEVVTFAQVDGSRIQILDAPSQLPGTCALCGTSRNDDRKYVDLGLTVDYVGVIYFCTFCMTELINRLGCLTQEQSAVLKDEVDSARKTILDFQSEKAAYDNAISTLRATGLFDGAPVHVTQTEPVSFKNVRITESQLNGPSKSTKQSDSKQGSSNVSTAGSDDFGF